MRILALVTDAFGGRGGIALYNRDFLTALCQYPGCDEVIAIPRLIPEKMEPLPNRLKYVQQGINSKFKYVITVLKTVKDNSHVDLLICGHINLLPIAFLIRPLLKCPVLLEIYGIEAWKPVQNRITRYMLNKIDALISISNLTKERFLKNTNNAIKSFVLPNAIHVEKYSPGHKNPHLVDRYKLNGKKVLMTMGRMSSEEQYKGFDEMIEILPRVLKKMPDISYLIIGDGTDRKRLEQKAEQFGVRQNVVFTGFVSEKEKADHLRLADVYVMPGKGEGFGFVFLEAMASGVPVIASKVDGSREAVLGGKLGMVVDPENPDEIEDAVLKALTYPDRKIPEGLEYFCFNNFQKRLHKIVDVVMNGGIA